MMNQLLRFRTLTLCTIFTVIAASSIEQLLPNNRREAWDSNSVLAQTAEEQIANQVYQKASPAAVTVQTGTGHGSGFVVSQDGFIITNAHVIKPPPQTQEELENYNNHDFPSVVTVVFADGRKVPADVRGFGKGGLDLAVLKIHTQSKLRTLPLAAAGSAKVGDRVFTLGTPLDRNFKDTFTQGYITRIDKTNGKIQHDAVIMGGNSGGPLLNVQGQVIGVNTSGISGREKLNTGMNFAIPVSQIQSFITAARKGDVALKPTIFERTKAPTVATISLNGQVVNGSLAEGDRTLEKGSLAEGNQTPEKGSFADLYQFQGRAGQQVVIEMTSQKINSFLTLYQLSESSEGTEFKKIAENDDRGPGDFNAQIATTLPEDGIYLIITTSQERGETGNYSLRATANP
ncbi:MAG: trypsin-like peptidase domain-containing protein [Scytonema hyalinum WJT4-NPBG1]|jgi:serine protease Do|nr:trypsin-like peptidase domain-containing protein [Scytonema hyalinum WJT4-NPBG1]